jgi:hypothetical protein
VKLHFEPDLDYQHIAIEAVCDLFRQAICRTEFTVTHDAADPRGVAILVGSPRLFEPACRTPRQMRLANALCRYRELAQAAKAAVS